MEKVPSLKKACLHYGTFMLRSLVKPVVIEVQENSQTKNIVYCEQHTILRSLHCSKGNYYSRTSANFHAIIARGRKFPFTRGKMAGQQKLGSPATGSLVSKKAKWQVCPPLNNSNVSLIVSIRVSSG